RVHVDERDEYTPGFKFNDWELKGVPLRIEKGPKDLEKNQVMLARRDTGEKISVKTEKVREEVERTLKLIQENLFERAKKTIEEHTKKANNYEELKKHLNGNWVIAPWCGKSECEEKIKEETGAKIPNIPFDLNKEKPEGKCVYCGRDAKYLVYFAKSY
ncbi:MAG TPA: proline--tRNA ligase, partial [Candidatus Aenigmarchaeota archaeon]|nr:proline--tRNA ligase [Candidatus Aenigmarchaeota archaeon]